MVVLTFISVDETLRVCGHSKNVIEQYFRAYCFHVVQEFQGHPLLVSFCVLLTSCAVLLHSVPLLEITRAAGLALLNTIRFSGGVILKRETNIVSSFYLFTIYTSRQDRLYTVK